MTLEEIQRLDRGLVAVQEALSALGDPALASIAMRVLARALVARAHRVAGAAKARAARTADNVEVIERHRGKYPIRSPKFASHVVRQCKATGTPAPHLDTIRKYQMVLISEWNLRSTATVYNYSVHTNSSSVSTRSTT